MRAPLLPTQWGMVPPESLPAEKPISKLEIDMTTPVATLFQPLNHRKLGIRGGHAIQKTGIHARSKTGVTDGI